jgi:hypothetical protein
LRFESQPDELGDGLDLSAESTSNGWERQAYSIGVDPSSLGSGETPDDDNGNEQIGRHDAGQPD